jgi:hypothetical protein
MLFHGLFIASGPKLYFMETLTCIQHGYWLGAFDHPAYLLDLRTPPPPFVGTPPSPGFVMVWDRYKTI